MTDIPYSQEIMRKTVHLSSLWMPVLILVAPQYFAALIFATLLSANIFIEYGYYKKWSLVLKTYGRLFGKMLRAKENDGHFRLSGSPYVLAAALCSCLFFSAVNAATALTVMLISDTAAALIGRIFGKHKINHNTKSIEGAISFLIIGWIVICLAAVFFHSEPDFIIRGIIGVVIAMIAEIYENRIKIDDNLSIPLIVGICLSF